MEIIELLSDADSPPPGDAGNPIVLDSDDEADQPGSSVYPLLEVSQSTPRRENIHRDPPSGSNHLARSHTLQSSFPPDASNTGDEFRDAEFPFVQRALPSPQPEHSIQAVDQPSVVNGETDQMPLPIQDSSEIQNKIPNGVSENTSEATSPVAPSLSPMTAASRNEDGRLAISRVSSSPNRSYLPPVDVSADSPVVPVRGTLYSGRSGLWKGFFRVTTTGSTSPSRPLRDVGIEEGDARPKAAPTSPSANSPCKVTPTTLVSLAQNMSIRSSPTPPSVDGSALEISDDDPADTTLACVPSALIGEPSL